MKEDMAECHKDIVTTPLVGTISGPSKGGKSRWAEHLIRNEPNVVYIATFDNYNDYLKNLGQT